jgi:hypothetical protein
MAELSALEDKFGAWEDEKPSADVSKIVAGRAGKKANTVSSRLYRSGSV